MTTKTKTLSLAVLLWAASCVSAHADCSSPNLIGVGNFGVAFTVPGGCTHMKVKLQGGGGNSHNYSWPFIGASGEGGGGGWIMAIFPVLPGDTYYWTAGSPSLTPGSGGPLARINWGAPFIPPGLGVIAAGSGGGAGGKIGFGVAGHGGPGGGFGGGPGGDGSLFGPVPGGQGASQFGGGFGGANPGGQGCTGGFSGGGPWVCNSQSPGLYGGRSGPGFYCGGSGASCANNTSPPDPLGAGGGGGGGSAGHGASFLPDVITLKAIPGNGRNPGGAGDIDSVGGYGQGAPGGRVASPGHQGGGARVVIAWDKDLQFNESNAPEDGDMAEICELPLTSMPLSFEWGLDGIGAPPQCQNDFVECRLTFESGSSHAVCRYTCTALDVPPHEKLHIFRVGC